MSGLRILGVDYGRTRTGISLSDPHGITCSPLTVIIERDRERLAEGIAHLVEEYGVSEVVLGLPRPLGGGRNTQTEEVLEFKAVLEKHTTAKVVLWDERFTTVLARRGRRSGVDDAIAACYLLQSYLDRCSTDG
ncbi:MAG: Holliday junction resolvase RuvX [Thermoleophilia bacterium]|nr:Holliday junction resolvase RuvX [Thermoleophilia bacterium]